MPRRLFTQKNHTLQLQLVQGSLKLIIYLLRLYRHLYLGPNLLWNWQLNCTSQAPYIVSNLLLIILAKVSVQRNYSDLQNLRRGPFSFPGFEF